MFYIALFIFLIAAFIVFKIMKGIFKIIVIALLVAFASVILVNMEKSPQIAMGIFPT